MGFIAYCLRDQDVINALAQDRASRMGPLNVVDLMRVEMEKKADQSLAIIGKYSKDGERHAFLEQIRRLRHKRLAHRETLGASAITAVTFDPSDQKVEELLQDSSNLIRLLLSLALGTISSPLQAAGVFRDYATLFWASVRGEQTEGHPNYAGAITAASVEGIGQS
jgi:hypothetical protein